MKRKMGSNTLLEVAFYNFEKSYGIAYFLYFQFIAHINDVNAKVAQQALDFFRPWAALLGSTWTTLVNDIHKRLEHLKPTSAPIF